MTNSEVKGKTHVFLPLEIFLWFLTITVPYFAACYLILVTNIMIRSLRPLIGSAAPWMDAIVIDLLSTSMFILAGVILAPRMKFPVSIIMCLAALVVHFNPAGVHEFMTGTVLGVLPESIRSMLPETGSFCSDNPLMYVGVIVVGASICFSQWKLSMAHEIGEKAYKQSIDSLYNPGKE